MVFQIRNSLKNKLIVPALIIILVGTGSFAAIAFNRAKMAFTKMIIEEINQVADTTITGMAAWINDRRIDVHDWSQQRLYQTALKPTFLGSTASAYASRQLKKIQSDYGYYENIVVSTVAGEAVAYAEPSSGVLQDRVSGQHRDGDLAYGLTHVSRQVFKSPVTGQFVFTILSPIIENGKVIGQLTGFLKANTLINRFIEPIQIGEKGYAYVFKDNGQIVSGSGALKSLGIDNIFRLPFGRRMQRSGNGIVEYTLNDAHMTAVVRRVDQIGLTLVVCAHTSEILSPVRELRNIYLGISLVVFILVGLALLLIADSLIQPIRDLVTGLEKMGRGDLAHRINVNTEDEIGSIGHAMNQMAAKLETSHRKINTQNKMLLQARDELEQKVEERTRELKQAEENYRSIYENAIEGIFRVDKRGRFIHANPSMARILGIERPDALTNTSVKELFVDPDAFAAFEAEFQDQGEIIGFETKIRRRDDSICWCAISVQIIKNATGDHLYHEGSLFDISERIEREKAEQEKEAAIAASRIKSEFLANMSHEIRTPLNAIVGFCGLLSDRICDRTQRNYIQSILIAANALLRLINDILDLSKMEAGKLAIIPTRVSIPGLIDEVRQLFEPDLLEKGLQFDIQVKSSFSHCLLLDEARLRQILVNLVGNAVKFTHQGHVRILAEQSPGKTPETCDLRICVEDTGIGIRERHFNKIFKSFEQVDSSGKKQYGGTGLGLPICKRLVTAMGGEISLTFSPEKGTRFTIEFQRVSMDSKDDYQGPVPVSFAASGVDAVVPLDPDQIPEVFKNRLLEDLFPRSLSFHEAVVINDVLGWAEELEALCEKHRLTGLEALCKEVRFHAESFDIQMIQKKMAEFSALVSRIITPV